MLEPSGTLGAVVVTATRPVMRQEDDKTIVEPENLAASSTNAYELIEKTPGPLSWTRTAIFT
jgi:iron complex outermembrane receptor protein